MLSLTWLIPVFPLLTFALIVLVTKHNKKLSSGLAIGAIAISWVFSWGVVLETFTKHIGMGEHAFHLAIPWLPTGTEWFLMGIYVDPLAAVMLFMVPFVCLMIFIYSVGYMHGDPRYSRFFAYISLFACGMLGLVIADNLLLLFIFWEIMGLCSYLLIGFWFEKPSAMWAGLKAFMTTRVGDVIMLAGLLLLYNRTGELSFFHIFKPETLHMLAETTVTVPLLGTMPWASLIAILIFGGAIGKSAQFPLHVWLPDAMEGPTPVSALIHAATMVSAGVYLVARMFPLFGAVEAGPQLGLVAFIGAFTAIFASTIAVAQNDIKRVLAYSTISQLGYMIAALGIGAYVAAVFHLIMHAFFKALLFLGSGSVIHGADTQDMLEMGGLRKIMPFTFWTFMAGTLALSGIPPFAGFWSKDEILADAFHQFTQTGVVSWPFFVWLLLTLSAFLTAFYMGRQIFLTFFGKTRRPETHAHESPKTMTYPLVVLAVFAVLLGLVGVPEDLPVLGPLFGNNPFHHFIGHGFEVAGHELHATPFSAAVMLISILMAVGGLFLGWLIYGRKPLKQGQPDPLVKALGPVHTLLKNKYYFDELYQATIIRFTLWLSETAFRFDARWVVDPIVNWVGRAGVWLSDAGNILDRVIVDGAVNGVAAVMDWAGRELRQTQTGKVQNYLLVVSVTIVVLLAVSLYL